MKKTTISAACALAAIGSVLAPQLAHAQQLTIQQEVASHPNMVRAIHQAEDAYRSLQEAPYDFGGRKVQAMSQLQAAIHSLRAALFYRLNMDDRAIDAAKF